MPVRATTTGKPSAPTVVRYWILFSLCVAASTAYLCRNSIGVAESTIRSELGLSVQAMGWVMSSFFLAYALAQLPTSWLGGVLGARRAIPLFAVAWSIATAAMGLATMAMGMPILLVARVGNGIAQAGLFPACTASIGRWFPDSSRAIASGSLGAFMSVGGAVGVAITGYLVTAFGWRAAFAGYGVLGVVFAIVFFLWFRDQVEDHAWANMAERKLLSGSRPAKEPGDENAWMGIMLSPPTWWICGQQFCRAAGQMFFGSWFATYLQETRDVSVAESGLLNSMPLISLVVGALIGGTVSDIVLRESGSLRLARSGVAAASMLLCAAFVIAAYFIQDPVLAVIVISLGTFCAAFGGPCAYTITIDMGGRNVPILFGTMNMVGNLGAFAFIRSVPMIREHFGWAAVLVLFAMLYVAAAFFWSLVNPNRTILEQSLYQESP